MFPFEIITFLVSNVVGIISSVWKAKIQNQARLEEAKLAALNERAKVSREIREHEDKGFKVTRRIMALSATFAILVFPMLAPLLPAGIGLMWGDIIADIPITFGYTQLDPGLWPFTSDVEITKWFTNHKGILITPWHTHLISAIWGFYFGASK